MSEITEYDIEQGKIVFEVFKNKMPDVAQKMEYMVKTIGWAGTEEILNKHRKDIPDDVWDLQSTALKYLHHKYQTDANKS